MAKQKFLTIVKIQKDSDSRCHLVDKNQFVIGRSPEADIFLTSSSLSRQHVTVWITEKDITLMDMGSSNGTFVNGTRLESNKKTTFPLHTPFQLAGPQIVFNLDILERPLEWEDHSTILKKFNQEAVKLFERASQEAELQAQNTVEQIIKNAKAQAENIIQEAHLKAVDDAGQLKIDARAQVEAEVAMLLQRAQEHAENLKNEAIESAKLKAKSSMEEEIQRLRQESHSHSQQIKLAAQKDADKILLEASQKAAEVKLAAEKSVETIYTSAKKSAQDTIQGADTQAEKIIDESRAAAIRIREEAQNSFEQINQMAKQRSSELTAHAEKEAEEILATAHTKAQHIIEKQKTECQIMTEDIRNRVQTEANESARLITDGAQAKLRTLQFEIEEMSQVFQKNQNDLKTLKDDIKEQELRKAHMLVEAKSFEDSIAHTRAKKTEVEQEKHIREKEVLQLSEQRMLLENKKLELSTKLEKLEKEIQDTKDQSLVEFDQQKQKQAQEIAALKSQAMLELKHLHQKEEEKFISYKASRRVQLAQRIEIELLPELTKQLKLSQLSNEQVSVISSKISFAVEHALPEVGERNWDPAGVKLPPIPTIRSRMFDPRIRRGVAMLAVIVGALTYVFKYHPEWLKPSDVKHLAAEVMEKNKQASTFKPVQTDKFRDTYLDNVLYMQNYANVKMDGQVQDRWAIELNDFFFKELRLSEEKMVKFIGIETALIKRLVQLSTSIDAKYLDEGLLRMKNLEDDELGKVRDLLGTSENFKKLRLREKAFVMNEMALRERTPAAQDPTVKSP